MVEQSGCGQRDSARLGWLASLGVAYVTLTFVGWRRTYDTKTLQTELVGAQGLGIESFV